MRKIIVITLLMAICCMLTGSLVRAANLVPSIRFNSETLNKALVSGAVCFEIKVSGENIEPMETQVTVSNGQTSAVDFTLADLPAGKVLLFEVSAIGSDGLTIKTIRALVDKITPDSQVESLVIDDTSTTIYDIANRVANKRGISIWQIDVSTLNSIKQKVDVLGLANLATDTQKDAVAAEIASPKPPTVVSVNPAHSSQNVAVDTGLTVVFSEQMMSSTIDTSMKLYNGTTEVQGNINYDTGNCTATFTPVTKLAYSTTYTAKILTTAKDLDNNALASEYVWVFTTGADNRPLSPTNLTAKSTNNVAALSWTSATGATSYKVYQKTGSGSYVLLGSTAQNSYGNIAVIPNTTYSFYVVASNTHGDSMPSGEISITSVGTPSYLNAYSGDGEVSLDWGSVSGATGYKVYYGTATGNYGVPISVNDTSCTVTGLTNGTTYYFAVTSVNTNTESAKAGEKVVKPLPPIPAPPKNLIAIATDGQVNLSWDASDGATSYRIYYGTTSGIYSNKIDLVDEHYNVTGLTNYTIYYFVVSALNMGGESVKSDEKAAFPKKITTPGMVYVNGGTFTMGDTLGSGASNQKPAHQVTVNSFFIGRYEVTYNEYDAFCTSTGRTKSNDNNWGRGSKPVMNITWYDCVEYCNWRSQQEGLVPVYTKNGSIVTCNFDANGYRLPTEAEWEYAAKGGEYGKEYLYSGSDYPREVALYSDNFAELGWRTLDVGALKGNELGLYDMSGNLSEWCWDWYDSGYYSISSAFNPSGPDSGSIKVLRGGSWYSHNDEIHVSFRDSFDPTNCGNYIGFRIAQSAIQ